MQTSDNVVKGLILICSAVLAGASPEPPVRWFGVIGMVCVAVSFAYQASR